MNIPKSKTPKFVWGYVPLCDEYLMLNTLPRFLLKKYQRLRVTSNGTSNLLLGSFGLNSTCPEEVISVSQTIRTTHSKGVDDIDPYIAILSIGSVATPLAR